MQKQFDLKVGLTASGPGRCVVFGILSLAVLQQMQRQVAVLATDSHKLNSSAGYLDVYSCLMCSFLSTWGLKVLVYIYIYI